MGAKWVAVFDFDGTCISRSYKSLYDVVDSQGGLTAECIELAEKMREYYIQRIVAGTLTKREQEKWLADAIGLYVRSELTYSKIGGLLAPVRLNSGVKDCFRMLRQRNIPVAIVSYGIFDFIEIVLSANDCLDLVDRIYSAHLIFGPKGQIAGFEPASAVFPHNKGEFSRIFARRHNVPYQNILAVGDSPKGDAKIGHLKKNRFGVAANESEREKLLTVMGTALVTESFEPVTKWILKKIDE